MGRKSNSIVKEVESQARKSYVFLYRTLASSARKNSRQSKEGREEKGKETIRALEGRISSRLEAKDKKMYETTSFCWGEHQQLYKGLMYFPLPSILADKKFTRKPPRFSFKPKQDLKSQTV